MTRDFTDLTLGAPRSAREALEAVGLSVDHFRDLFKLKVHRSIFNLVSTLGTFAAVPLVAWLVPHPVTYVVCLALAVHNFNCFAQLVHASDHGTLFRNKPLNALVGNLCAYPLGYVRSGHRNAHLDHHLYLNTEKDPDLIFNPPDQTARGLLVAFSQDLLLLSALKRFIQYFQVERGRYAGSPWHLLSLKFFTNLGRGLVPVLLTQAAIFALFFSTAGPWFYVWFHVLPIVTLYPAQIRMRSMVEHSFEPGFRSSDTVWITRTTRPNFLEGFIVAPLGQNYHYEHHLFPTITEYHLATAHQLLVQSGISVPLSPGYVRFLFHKIRAEIRLAWATA